MMWVWFYLASVAIAALLLGFNTKASNVKSGDLVRVVIGSVAWPIVSCAAFGHALRPYSAKRRAEDVPDQDALLEEAP